MTATSYPLPEFQRLKLQYNRTFLFGVVAAITIMTLVALFYPPYIPHPYQLRERVLQAVDLAEEFVVPPPPVAIERPVLPMEAEISDAADVEETLAPTTYDPFAPPVVPLTDANTGPEVFVAYDSPPEVLHKVAPVYPELARQAEAEGLVVLRVWVNADGKADQFEVFQSEVLESMERAAIAAVRQWVFKPAMQRDHPVRVPILVPLRFALN